MRISPILLASLMFLLPGTAGAQPGEAGHTLREQLRRGDRVTLVLDGGVVKGKLDSVGPEELVVRTASGAERVPFASVTEARRTRRGFLLGAFIGAAAGGASGAVLGTVAEHKGGSSHGAAILSTAVSGALIGAGIDALVNFERTVYRRQGSPAHLSVAPLFSPAGAGVRASVWW